MSATFSFSPVLYYHNYFKPSLKLKTQSFSSSLHLFKNNTIMPPPCFSASQRTGVFLTNDELKKLEFLQDYTYSCKIPSGYLSIRVMNDLELDMIVGLLAESFAESMFLPDVYLTVLGFLIRQYLVERRGLLPHAVTLVGFFRGEEMDGVNGDGVSNGGEEVEGELGGTVEVSFDRRGANPSPPTPTPPKDFPYICNMTVKKHLRRRGIGWHLLKASEELISNMTSSRNVYLHCRMIDTAPLSMYKKAGYDIVKTDSVLILFKLQRRKHLMCKDLPVLSKPLETVAGNEEEELRSSMDKRELEPLMFNEVMQSSPDMDK